MPACSAFGCQNRHSEKSVTQLEAEKTRKITFHSFPKNEQRRELWIKAVERKDWKPSASAKICSDHFTEDCFDRTSLCVVRLWEHAVPNIFPEFPSYLQKGKKTRKPLSNRSENATTSLLAVEDTPAIQENAVIEEKQHKVIRRKRKTKSCWQTKRKKKAICPTISKPAKVDHVQKGSPDPCHMLEELPALYMLITLPHLEQEQFNLQWVYNIISGERDQDRVVYESPCKDDKDGFVLIKDSRWDGVSLENLHLLALPYRPGLLSLRDLRENHLKLLQNIYNEGKGVIWKKYGVIGSQLHIFLEYQPSFYHLNVHFTAIHEGTCDTPVGKTHLLYSVINNILLCPNYYQDASLPFCLKESDSLFSKFEAHGLLRRIGNSR